MFTFKKISKCIFSLRIAYFDKYVSIVLLHIHKMSSLKLYITSEFLIDCSVTVCIARTLTRFLQNISNRHVTLYFSSVIIKLNLYLPEDLPDGWTGPICPLNVIQTLKFRLDFPCPSRSIILIYQFHISLKCTSNLHISFIIEITRVVNLRFEI